ncbi:hypothetical protein [Wenzhouxiangella marina]|uniref:Uncharacterized protein n=1 Tax=Wenzhouxiangella marina TaxID=1579979 RepID=A0A0K0XZH2_9GAMM|nr:hypothetical protein [Wenzhouxiangella marina]AKS43088.1 hypothetical protein WM2015_2730 [Wenzhouxiangella marina]MBB6087228.1 hypothetical protein [Wenzhouxiangella marina]
MMPDGSYTVDALLKFLKQAGMEGMINPAVARSRRNAIEQLQSEMSDEERRDLRCLDVDQLASRFHKLEGSSIRVEALALYVERFKSALEDFLGWNEHPASFKTVGGDKARAVPRRPDGRSAISQEQAEAERTSMEIREAPAAVVPIALRPDLTVHVAGIPIDLTRSEAERIARVVRAYVVDEDASTEDGK